jgi:hypothetical protein
MKHLFHLLLWGTLMCCLSVQAADQTAELAASFEEKISRITQSVLPGNSTPSLPGVSLAQGITEVTGVAVSPLLGVSAIGAWKYWHASASERASLPWFCQPWAWGLGLAIAGLCFGKDVFGAALPGVLKKPFDWLELFEDKASALIASTAFVPLVALAMAEYQRIAAMDQAMVNLSSTGFAAVPMLAFAATVLQSPWVTVPLSLALFAVVWLTSHVAHVLIALSPFSLVDTLLKSAKAAVLALLLACAAMIPTVSPLPALVVCGMIALVCTLLAGWSFRLLVFGGQMVSDLLLRRKDSGSQLREKGIWGFLARPYQGLPVRKQVRIVWEPETSSFFFYYRPWLLLPERRVKLEEAPGAVLRGLLHPGLAWQVPDRGLRRACNLLPRYRGSEEKIAAHLGGLHVRDTGLIRGFKAMQQWLSDTLGNRPSREVASLG